MRKGKLVAAAVVAVGIAGGSAAYALARATDSSAQIVACVKPAGDMRIVGPSDTCKSNESRLVWNVQGPQGIQGIQGPAGRDGRDGASAPIPNTHDVATLEVAPDVPVTSVRSWTWGISNSVSVGSGGGGAGTGKASFDDLTITKKLDASSPKLLAACAEGKHYSEATLVVTSGGTTTTYKLKDVFVTSVKQSDDGATETNPLEKVTFTFGAFEAVQG
jgi:type VI protein secretion system component Hcp